MKFSGYQTKQHAIPTKQYCQTVDLKDDLKLLEWEDYMSVFQKATNATSAENQLINYSINND